MATTTAPSRNSGPAASGSARPAGVRASPGRRRRHLPLVVVGVMVVIGCALAFADVSLRSGHGAEVLVVAQPVPAGQVLTGGDLRAVKLSAPSGVASVPAGEEQAVLGQPAAVPLTPGSVLTRAEVGSGALVGAGSDVVAAALKAGAYPPDLAPGDKVQVIPVSSASGSSVSGSSVSGSSSATGSAGPTAQGPLPATVMAVQGPSAASGSPAVVSLVVARSDAAEVASLAAAGEVALVEVGGGG